MSAKKRSTPAIHVCRFVGKVANAKPPKGTRCELDSSKWNPKTGFYCRCSARAVAYVVYRWGGAALCAKHVKEEVTS